MPEVLVFLVKLNVPLKNVEIEIDLCTQVVFAGFKEQFHLDGLGRQSAWITSKTDCGEMDTPTHMRGTGFSLIELVKRLNEGVALGT